ncbi:MAG: pyrroline-5-carboxylate reductase [Cyanobium sp. NAT70]|nr:pyrroline-5-carboxylate reductase [Cyanobium sp. NAT70]
MRSAFGVIGLGRMAWAIVEPLLKRGVIPPEQLVTVVGSELSASRLNNELPDGITVYPASSAEARSVWQAPVQLLAIKPQQLDAVAAEVPAVNGQPLLISVLAGVRLERLQRLFPSHRCVRSVPNTPALVGSGLTALAWGDSVLPDQRQQVTELFSPVSEVMELPEEKLDAFLALTSSGPAFLALVAEAMADGAVAAGLPRPLAQHLSHRTLAGTAALLHQRNLHPGELKDMVSSPGGTTIAGIRCLEQAGLRSALIEAVVAAAERSRELA